jgi:predicted site-specific integrase-resolvase
MSLANDNPDGVDADELHGTRAAAWHLHVCEQTVRNWCEQGQLKAIRTSSRRWLVAQSEIDRVLRGAE